MYLNKSIGVDEKTRGADVSKAEHDRRAELKNKKGATLTKLEKRELIALNKKVRTAIFNEQFILLQKKMNQG